MYTTKYGQEIEDKYFSGMNRFEVRTSVLTLFEMGLIRNGEPVSVEFGESVPNDNGGKSCGSVVPRTKWRAMMHIMAFTEGSSSSEGWQTWSIGGLTRENSSQTSHAQASIIEDYQWASRTISHSLVINYRKRDGSFFVYSGNIEDLYSQVSYLMRTAFHAKVAAKFGI